MRAVRRLALVLALAALAAGPALAQAEAPPARRLTASFGDPARPGLLKVTLLSGDISVEAHGEREVVVEVRQRPAGQVARRAPASGPTLRIVEDGNVMRVDTPLGGTLDLRILVPAATSLKLRCVRDGDLRVRGVAGEMDLRNTAGAIEVEGAAAPVVAHNDRGSIAVRFARLAPGPMAFSTLHGDIEVAFPEGLAADVVVQSRQGDVTSDFPVVLVDAARRAGRAVGLHRLDAQEEVRGRIGAGGPELRFTTYGGDVTLRRLRR